MKNLKIRVNNERERIEIQELLFNLGYAWWKYGTEINTNDYVKYIYAKTSKLIFHGVMAMDFINDPSKQVTIYDLKAMLEEKDTTERGGEVKINIEKEFVLPKNWCVCPKTEENLEVIKKSKLFPEWINNYTITRKDNCYTFDREYYTNLVDAKKEGYTEITFKEFEKYVLNNQEEVKPKHPKVWAWDNDVTVAFETYLIAEFTEMQDNCNYLVVGKNWVTDFENKHFFETYLYQNISYTNPNTHKKIEAIAKRIKKEFEKHSELDWAMIAAHKIYSSHIKQSK